MTQIWIIINGFKLFTVSLEFLLGIFYYVALEATKRQHCWKMVQLIKCADFIGRNKIAVSQSPYRCEREESLVLFQVRVYWISFQLPFNTVRWTTVWCERYSNANGIMEIEVWIAFAAFNAVVIDTAAIRWSVF